MVLLTLFVLRTMGFIMDDFDDGFIDYDESEEVVTAGICPNCGNYSNFYLEDNRFGYEYGSECGQAGSVDLLTECCDYPV